MIQKHFQNSHSLADATRKLSGFILLLMLSFFSVSAGEGPGEPRRKTVGVVLSGGGAKGVAHIGVLKALEENNIPIDYIAGTSIGAMVGGLYAAGYSPDEILELMSSREFNNASQGRLDKKNDFYFFHHDPAPVWFSVNYGLEHTFNFQSLIRDNLPSNIVSPGMMDFMFMEVLAPASAAAGNDFDNLFIPFRCIASDITNKEAVVMRNGHLSEAVRASMTFPFYFKPIAIDGKVLFDGGMFNNFPANVVMEDFKPDIIIGSVVASNPNPPSVHDIISQLENMLMVFSDYSLPEGAEGIILYPDVPDLSITDFSKNAIVAETGYRVVTENLDSILSFNPRTKFIQEVRYHRMAFRNSYPANKLAGIILQEDAGESGDFARSFLQPEAKELSLPQLRENYYRLLSVNKFRHIYPRLHFNESLDAYELELELKKNFPFRRCFGGNLSSRSINQFFGMFSYEKLSKYPLTLSANFFVGNNYNSGKVAARVDFLRRVPFYLVAETSISRWSYASESVFLFEEQKPSFIIQSEFRNDLRFVFPWGYKGKIESGMFFSRTKNEFYNSSIFSRSDTTDLTRLSPLGLYFSMEKNTLDHYQYPSSGSFFNVTTRLMGSRERYYPGSTSFSMQPQHQYLRWWEASLKWENFFGAYQRVRPAIVSELFFSNRPLLHNYSASRLISPQYSPFAFARTRYLDTFRANQFGAIGLKTNLMLGNNWFILAEMHAFQPFKDIVQAVNHSAMYERAKFDPAMMYHAALVFHTPMGPLSAGISYFDGKEDPTTFVINFGYILFNRRTF